MSVPKQNISRPGALDQGEQNDVTEIHAAVLREKPEPQEGFEPVNLWIVAFIAGLLFWGGSYLTQYSGRFEADEFSEIQHGKPAPVSAVAADPAAAQKREGMVVFNGLCANCHNDDGMGKPGVAPQLVGSDWVNDPGIGRLVRIVVHGVQGPIKINATTEFNMAGAQMPSQFESIGNSDAKLAAVLTYIRTSWGNTGKPVSTEEVKAVREAAGQRENLWNAEELMAIPSSGAAPAAAPAGAPVSPEDLKKQLQGLPADQLQNLLKELSK